MLVTSADTYSLSVNTTGYPLCIDTFEHTVTETDSPTLTIIPSSLILTDGGTINLTSGVVGGTPPYTYDWTSVGGTIIGGEGQDVTNINITSAAEYFLTVTDDNGCTDNGSVIVVDEVIADTQAPQWNPEANLIAEQVVQGGIDIYLNWWPADDNIGVDHYVIERWITNTTEWTEIDTVYAPIVEYTDTSGALGYQYVYRIIAYDSAGNPSIPSNTAFVYTYFCLVEGTQLLNSEGDWTCIEDLIEGEELIGANLNDIHFNVNKPLEWESEDMDEIVSSSKITTISPFETYNTIIINKGLLETTPSHIQLINRDDVWKFTSMKDIKEGDKLYDIYRELIEVTDIEVNTEKRIAYKLKLEAPNHMCFANKILTNN
jgi:hypothetical protein